MKTKSNFAQNLFDLYATAERVGRDGPDAGPGKMEFHRLGKSVLRAILKQLEVPGDVRSCLGGPAVVGEVILHTDKLYVQFCTSGFGGPIRFMYRTCKGRKDYTGGHNRWHSYQQLVNDPQDFLKTLKDLMEEQQP